MRKKDYELIAGSLRRSWADFLSWEPSTRELESVAELYRHLTDNITQALGAENPRFDQDKFLTACGIESGADRWERESLDRFKKLIQD